MKKNRDVKFVIYQMLYIFVVCVIALKGANLDLTEVIQKEKVVEKEYADSLKKILDSLLALGLVPEIKFDTSKKFTNPEELRRQLEITRQQLISVQQQNPSLTVSTTSPNFTTNNPNLTPEEIKKLEEMKKEEQIIEPKEVQEIRIGNPVIVQFAQNTMNNPYDQPLEIVGITTIPPKGSKTFITGGEGSVTLKVGTTTKTVQTKPNDKPKISLQRLVPAGENVSIRSVQGTVGYRITINDDFPGNLDVNFNGPVTVNQTGPTTYDVTLNFLKSKTAFDNYTDGKDAPYSVGFQVSVKDKIAGHSLTQSGVFQFGEW
ncbi:MAG: hypothetical protein IAE65_00495 [Ignavibacteria bacterium]|nr:hypothetical protein [Ignavibacteria bacterium]